MKINVFFVVHSLIIFGNTVDAIVNGRNARRGEYPYMISLWHNGCDFYCGGAILDKTHVLTAAHCVYDDQTPSAYTVQAGTINLEASAPGTLRIKVKKIHTFDYVKADVEKMARQAQLAHAQNDVAVLTLEEPLTFSDNIQAVERPKSTDSLPPFTVSCRLTGWGSTTREPSPPAPHLLFLDLRILSSIRCKLAYAEVRSKELCAAHDYNTGTSADGDSGGPLVCKGTIYGVLSNGAANQKYPIVFMSVISYMDSIEKALKD